MMRLDIFAQIHDDHEQVYILIHQWMQQGHGEGRTVADQLSDAFLPHAKAEEVTLYAALREHEAARREVAQAAQEHRAIEYQIGELRHATPGRQPLLRERLAELRERIRSHVENEEGSTFAMARRLLPEERLAALGERFPVDKQDFREQYWLAA
jgi:hemerythrin-like domain-containing protein